MLTSSSSHRSRSLLPLGLRHIPMRGVVNEWPKMRIRIEVEAKDSRKGFTLTHTYPYGDGGGCYGCYDDYDDYGSCGRSMSYEISIMVRG